MARRLRGPNPGFTILELLFTLAIAGTLTAIAVPQGLRALDDFRTRAAARYLAQRLAARLAAEHALARAGINPAERPQYAEINDAGCMAAAQRDPRLRRVSRAVGAPAGSTGIIRRPRSTNEGLRKKAEKRSMLCTLGTEGFAPARCCAKLAPHLVPWTASMPRRRTIQEDQEPMANPMRRDMTPEDLQKVRFWVDALVHGANPARAAQQL